MTNRPTIKGIFVNSHIKQLARQKGESALAELEKRYGKAINFKNSDEVLISDEVEIITHCLDILNEDKIDPSQKDFEAGRLHFRNFMTTPLARIVVPFFKSKYKTILLNAKSIAGHVFRGVDFESKVLGEKSVQVTMRNNDYPLEHFKGLFQEWMNYSGLEGRVEASTLEPNTYVYQMTWK